MAEALMSGRLAVQACLEEPLAASMLAAQGWLEAGPEVAEVLAAPGDCLESGAMSLQVEQRGPLQWHLSAYQAAALFQH